MNKKHSSIAQQESETEFIKNESERTKIEKYSAYKIRSWGFTGPVIISLASIVLGIYGLYALFVDKSYDVLLLAILFFIVSLTLIAILISVDDAWNRLLAYKYQIHQKNPEHSFLESYYEEYIYTDSGFQYYLYQTCKFISYLLTITIGGLAILLVRSWRE